MALDKQQVTVNFSKGLDTKTDPWQVPIGNFINLENTVFTKMGLLEKRKGFDLLNSTAGTGTTSISTFKNELVTLGDSLNVFEPTTNTLINKGTFKPIKVTAQTLLKNTSDIIQVDTTTNANGISCTVFIESVSGVNTYKYLISNYQTGQIIAGPTAIPAAGGGTVNSAARVYSTTNYFAILYGATVSSVQQLQCVLINKSTYSVGTPFTVSADLYLGKSSFDAVWANNFLYVVWGRASAAGIYATTITEAGVVASATSIQTTFQGDKTSIIFDSTASVIFIAYYSDATNVGRVTVRNTSLGSVSAPQDFMTAGSTTKLLNITLASVSGTCQIIWDRQNYYSYDTAVPTSYIQKRTVTSAGVLGTSPGTTALVRSLGLGAEAFVFNGAVYIVGAYQSAQQSGYYLLDISANVIGKWCYTNGGGYPVFALPNSTVVGTTVNIPYLIQYFTKTINKDNADPTLGVYSQIGSNLATVYLQDVPVYTAELGNNLNMSGGFLWAYDGALPNENNFFVYPENVEVVGQTSLAFITATYTNNSNVVTVSSSAAIKPGYYLWSFASGWLIAQIYRVTEVVSSTSVKIENPYPGTTITVANTQVWGDLWYGDYSYNAIYEWVDNQGNFIRSAPSIPVSYKAP